MTCGDGYEEYSGPGMGVSTGSLFIDGSCTVSPIRGLARAGSCVTEIDRQGNVLRELRVPVPQSIRQTAQAAEHVGYFAAVTQLLRRTDFYVDCKGVQVAATGNQGRATGARMKNGGIILAAHAIPERRNLVGAVHWVKAHRSAEQEEDAEEKWRILGNAAADAGAEKAVQLHPQPAPEHAASLAFYTRRFELVAKAVGAALELFPSAGGRMERLAPPKSEQQARQRGCHVWRKYGDTWRCDLCWTWSNRRDLPLSRKVEMCKGPRDQTIADRYSGLGHSLRTAKGDPPFAYCARCGGTSLRRAYKLAERCREPNANGRLALSRISKGLHPWRRKAKGGRGEEQRGLISADEAYDAVAGCWMKSGRDHHGVGVRRKSKQSPVKIKAGRDTGMERIRAEPSENGRADQIPDRGDDLPSQACENIVVHDMDETPHGYEHGFAEEEDVFGHGASMDEHMDQDIDDRSSVVAAAGSKRARAADNAEVMWPRGDGCEGQDDSSVAHVAASVPALTAGDINFRCTFIERQGTDAASRNLATLSVHRGVNRVTVFVDDDEEPRLVCDLGQIARARRASPYAILLEKLDVRLVCTSIASADALHQGAKSAQACCHNCGGIGGYETMWTRDQCSHTMCLPCVKEAQLATDLDVEHEGCGEASFGQCPVCARISAKFRKIEAGLWTTDDQEAELHDHRRRPRGAIGYSGLDWQCTAAALSTSIVAGDRGGKPLAGRYNDEGGEEPSSTSLSRQTSVAERMARLRERIRRRAEEGMRRVVAGESPVPAASEDERGEPADCQIDVAANRESSQEGGLLTGTAAPCTPVVIYNEVDYQDLHLKEYEWEVRGCGCNGRIHQECARWMRPREGSGRRHGHGEAVSEHVRRRTAVSQLSQPRELIGGPLEPWCGAGDKVVESENSQAQAPCDPNDLLSEHRRAGTSTDFGATCDPTTADRAGANGAADPHHGDGKRLSSGEGSAGTWRGKKQRRGAASGAAESDSKHGSSGLHAHEPLARPGRAPGEPQLRWTGAEDRGSSSHLGAGEFADDKGAGSSVLEGDRGDDMGGVATGSRAYLHGFADDQASESHEILNESEANCIAGGVCADSQAAPSSRARCPGATHSDGSQRIKADCASGADVEDRVSVGLGGSKRARRDSSGGSVEAARRGRRRRLREKTRPVVGVG